MAFHWKYVLRETQLIKIRVGGYHSLRTIIADSYTPSVSLLGDESFKLWVKRVVISAINQLYGGDLMLIDTNNNICLLTDITFRIFSL